VAILGLMNELARKLEHVLDRLPAEGTVSVAELKAIVHAIELAQDVPAAPALSGVYWEARHRALLDRSSDRSVAEAT
jgi:hypothetical protein